MDSLDTPEALAEDAPPPEGGSARVRRALLVTEGEGTEELLDKLSDAGLQVSAATADEAPRRITEGAFALVLIVFGGREGEGRLITLARRLRAEPETFALPVVFLFREDGRALRSAALHLGADDYFALDAPREEVRARLEALFWRVEAGRRTAPSVAAQRDEIDNFIFLLDAVTADAQRGARGTVALVEAATAEAEGPGSERALRAAHGHLKLNLRRVDAVAFYGPSALLVYLPGAGAPAAQSTLSRLREEFVNSHPRADIFAGLASFPEAGVEVERLVERAEAALGEARAENSRARVLVYKEEGQQADSGAPRGAEAREGGEAGRGAARDARQETFERAPEPPREAAAQAGERRTRGPLKSRRMLLAVSDAARMAQVNLLMRSAGYEVRAAFDAHHALSLLRIDRPDLLLVDYELQGVDGVEMLRRLRKQSGNRAAPPAVMLVPAGREELRRGAREAGARGVVEVPYDPVELLDTLSDACDPEE